MKVLIKTLLLLAPGVLLAQTTPSPLQVTQIKNITSSTTCIDNRSVLRQNQIHGFFVSGTGTWSVQIQYSQTSCNGPWTSYGTLGLVTNSSSVPIGYGFDGATFHNFISFAITGTVAITYSGEKQLYFYPGTGGGGGGSPSFSAILSGDNNSGQTLTVGGTTVLTYSDTGVNNANQILGTSITGFLGNSGVLVQGNGAYTPGDLGSFNAGGNLIDSTIPAANVIVNTATYNNPAWITGLAASKVNGALSCSNLPGTTGDVTQSAGSCATVVTTTNGVAFAASATTNALNASNITSGTLSSARLPAINLAGTGAGGVVGNLQAVNFNSGLNASSGNCWTGNMTWQPCVSGGTVTNTFGPLILGQLMVGNGGNDSTTVGTLGTTTTMYHGNAAGTGSFGPAVLTTDVSGVLPGANGGTNTAFLQFAGPTALRTYTGPDANATLLTTNAFVTMQQGGTGADLSAIAKGGMISGTGIGTVGITVVGTNGKVWTANSGATGGADWEAVTGTGTVTNIACTAPLVCSPSAITTTGTISGATLVTSAASLANNQLVIGQGGQATATLGSTGTTTQVLIGNSGLPSWGSVALATMVSGTLPAGNLPATIVYNGQINTYGAFLQDFSSATVKVPNGSALAPTTSALLGYNTTTNLFVGGINGTTGVLSYSTASTPVSGNCVAWGSNYSQTDVGSTCANVGANHALSNLSGVSINTSLLAQTGVDLGGTANPFRNLYLFGAGTYGSTSLEITGTPTAARVWTVQDATDTFVGRATTDTLTNKTYDTAGTGNTFEINGTQITAITGNTATLLTYSGSTPVSGHCPQFDVNHNLVDSGATCSSGSGGAPPYTATVSAQTSLTVTASTHGDGLTPIAACFDNSTPRNLEFCSYSVSSTGTVVFSWNPAFTGLIEILSGQGGGGGGGLADPGANGIVVRTAANVTTAVTLTAGTGILVANGTGVSGNPTVSYNSAVVPTHATVHANESFCNSTNGTMSYTCSFSSTSALTVYSSGMTVSLKVDTTNAGAANVNIDGVGNVNIKQADGSTDPVAGQIRAGVEIPITYNGAVFTLPPALGSASVQANAGSQTQILKLKPNSGGVNTIIWDNATPAKVTDYNFSAITPVGSPSLIAGSQTVTIPVAPLGVNGSDTNHYLYVSGGTGTAEAVPITTGTCTELATVCTLTMTFAFPHSGAYNFTSASSGVAESIQHTCTATSGGSIWVPSGSYSVYAPIYFPCGVALRGDGKFTSLLVAESASTGVLDISGVGYNGSLVQDIGFNTVGKVQGTAGSYCIRMGNGSGNQVSWVDIQRIYCEPFYDGVLAVNASQYNISESVFYNFSHTGITVNDTTNNDFDSAKISRNEFYNYNLSSAATACVLITSTGGIHISDNNCQGSSMTNQLNAGIVLDSTVSSQLTISNNTLSTFTNEGILLEGGVYNNIAITGNNILFPTTGSTAYAIIVNGSNVTNTCVGICQMTISGNTFQGPGTTGSSVGLYFQNYVGNTMIGNNTFFNWNLGITTNQITGSGTVTIAAQNMESVTTPFNASNIGSGTKLIYTSPTTYANIPTTIANGSVLYVSDSNSTCSAGSGNGRTCFRENGVWLH